MFIEILEKTLKEKNITFNKLAKDTGIGQSSTDRWKHGSFPTIDKLEKICKYLNVSADYLLELEIEPPPDRMQRLDEKEQLLIQYYRTANDTGQEYILEDAKREAERYQRKETSSNLKIV